MKKLISTLLSLCIIGGSAPALYSEAPQYQLTANAKTDSSGKEYTEIVQDKMFFRIYEDHAEFAGVNAQKADRVVIPEKVNGLPVTAISDYAFHGYSVKSVSIPDTVVSIGLEAFYECTDLIDITIPSSVKHIGEAAFARAADLVSVTLSRGVPMISMNMFARCKKLETITILDPDCEIYDEASTISNTYGSVSGTGFDGLIRAYAGSTAEAYARKYGYYFDDISQWELTQDALTFSISYDHAEVIACDRSAEGEIIVPGEINGVPVTRINDSAFMECTGITAVELPDSVTCLDNKSFYGCSELSSVKLPASLVTIGSYAFALCGKLEEIEIPDSIVMIDNYAFKLCTSLKAVTIPFSAGSIGSGAFSCTGLDVITFLSPDCKIADADNTICNDYDEDNKPVFNGVIRGYNDSTADAYAKKYSRDFTELKYSEVTEGPLTYAVYVDHAEVIACDKDAGGEVEIASEIDGISVTKIGTKAFCFAVSVTGVTIPDTVTEIGSFAFDQCYELSTVTIPDSVSSIREAAFNACKKLKDVNIPPKLTTIEKGVFAGCESLTSFTIPDNITGIDSSAFIECTGLKSITIPESVKYIDSLAFLQCSSLRSVTIMNPDCRLGINFLSNLIEEDPASFTADHVYKGIISGFKDSTAQRYAQNKDISFIALDEPSTSTDISVSDVKGDANCDSEVNMSDVVMVMQSCLNPLKYGANGTSPDHITAQGELNSNVDGKEGVDLSDALLIQKYSLGIIDSL